VNWSSVYRLAEEEDERRSAQPNSHDDTFAAGALWGAGWMAALIGMAEAIRASHPFDVPWRFPCAYCGLPVDSVENHDGYLDREKHACPPSPFAVYLAERIAGEGRLRGGWQSPPSSKVSGSNDG
jgi:hypothetical protein